MAVRGLLGTDRDPTKAPKIFNLFYTTKPSGMGMELSISRSTLQAHGGRLWLRTAKATIFHSTFPNCQEIDFHAGAGGGASLESHQRDFGLQRCQPEEVCE
jgi:hypothetical protein